MVDTPPITVTIDTKELGKVIADSIEEAMADWERELLNAFTVPRVVKDRSEFRAGQIIAFVMGNTAAIARVTKAEGGEVYIDGRYLDSVYATPVIPPLGNEIHRGRWMILSEPA